MTRTTWRFSIDYYYNTTAVLSLPEGATLLHVEAEKLPADVISLWFEVDPEALRSPRTFEVFGTGHPIPDGYEYRGTAIARPLILHVYEAVQA